MKATNPVLVDFPDSFETKRLVIRAPRAGDGKELFRAVIESWEHLSPWIPWAMGEKPTQDEQEVTVRKGAARWLLREDLWMLVFEKESGKMIGGTGLHRLDWSIPRAEIGYWISKDCEGRGFVSEAVRGVAAFAFDHLKVNRLEIRCDPRNMKSMKVAERLGFKKEALLVKNYSTPAGLADCAVYVMFNKTELI